MNYLKTLQPTKQNQIKNVSNMQSVQDKLEIFLN